MTAQRHVSRSMVLASVTALLAVTTAGSAAAYHDRADAGRVTARPPAAALSPGATAATLLWRVQVGVATSSGDAVRRSAASPSTVHPASLRPPARARATAVHPRSAPVHAVTIRRYVVAPGSQRAIDRCNLVLWTRHPLWLAGHNWCGYQWLAFVRTGTVVTVSDGPAAGRYVVTGHVRLHRQSGALPRVGADLVLQTCVGSSTGLTLARRLR